MDELSEAPTLALDKSTVADLIVDLWRIHNRVSRAAALESIQIACERALERVELLGFRIDEMTGLPYNENMRVTVTHRDGGSTALRISECLAPAIYYSARVSGASELIRTAEVVIEGGDINGTPNS